LHGNMASPENLTNKPLAHILKAKERSRGCLWLQDQGMQKLVAAVL
jgi:hypothetical protein